MAKRIMYSASQVKKKRKKKKVDKIQSMGQRLILIDWFYCEIFLQSITKLGAQHQYCTVPAQDY